MSRRSASFLERCREPGAVGVSLADIDLRKVLDGHGPSTERFVAELKARALAIARRQYRFSQPESEDVAAQVAMRLWQNDLEALRRFRGEAPLETYLAVVVNRECLMRLRARRRSPVDAVDSLPAGAAVDPPEDRAEARQRWEACAAALARLGERDRSIIGLRYVEGLDYPAIVARLGISNGAARKALHTALQRLRAEILSRSPELLGGSDRGHGR
jgi:RNA polymerase sigma factor (sigma-70 family)